MSLREPLSAQQPKDSCRASFCIQDVTFPAPPSGSDPIQDPDVPQAIGYTRLHRHPQPENGQLITPNEGLLLGQLWGKQQKTIATVKKKKKILSPGQGDGRSTAGSASIPKVPRAVGSPLGFGVFPGEQSGAAQPSPRTSPNTFTRS